KNQALIDSFEFLGSSMVPALADFEITWEAKGPAAVVGKGKDAASPKDTTPSWGGSPRRGHTSRAPPRRAASASAPRARPTAGRRNGGWAHIGRERNGSFL